MTKWVVLSLLPLGTDITLLKATLTSSSVSYLLTTHTTFKHQNLSLHINHPYLTYFFLLTSPAGFVVYTLEKICARFVIIIIIQSFQVVSY